MVFHDYNLPFRLYTDVSLIAVGPFLAQARDDRKHIMVCAIIFLTTPEKSNVVTKRESLIIDWALQHFGSYISSAHQSLQWLRKSDICSKGTDHTLLQQHEAQEQPTWMTLELLHSLQWNGDNLYTPSGHVPLAPDHAQLVMTDLHHHNGMHLGIQRLIQAFKELHWAFNTARIAQKIC